MVLPLADRVQAMRELQLRMIVARSLFSKGDFVIGMASESNAVDNNGYSIDICYMNLPEWDEDKQVKATEIKNELGYFRKFKTFSHDTLL